MERLTQRIDGYLNIWGRTALYEAVERPGAYLNNAIVRLAAYEDTGLTPEEVKLIANVLREVGETYNCWFNYVAQCVIEHSKLQELVQAEKDGRLVVSRFNHGDCVWAIERDEYGEALDVAGSMFLAEVLGFVIASAYINGMTEAEKTLSYHMQETVEGYDTTLMVFPSEDVYQTKAEAETALREDKNA